MTAASQGGAQREPSMEEILASIRRIIEDNDGARPGEEVRPPAPANTSAPLATARSLASPPRNGLDRVEPARVEPVQAEPKERSGDAKGPFADVGAVIEVDAFRAELRGALPADADDWSPKPARLVAAATGASRWNGEASAVREAAATAPAKPVTATPGSTRLASSPAPAPAPAPEPSVTARVAAVSAAPAPAPKQPPAVAAAAIADKPATPVSTTMELAQKGTILSEQAGRKIAASFGQLSEAFAARSQQTFDELAEEMMRPMLQDWLDNNLPTLVERLVREEIERIARGA